MDKPDLNRIWETFIKISPEQSMVSIIGSKLFPMLHNLKNSNMIKWYCFLIDRSRLQDDRSQYFHIRLEPNDAINDKEQLNQILPDYCEKQITELCKNVENLEIISGINKTLLRDEDIAEAWRIIGEQSEWLMDLVNIHKDVEIPIGQITQFMHFYLNMLGLGGRATLYFGPTFQF